MIKQLNFQGSCSFRYSMTGHWLPTLPKINLQAGQFRPVLFWA
jgi:hypothetical protein